MDHRLPTIAEDYNSRERYPVSPHQVWEAYSIQPTPEQKVYLVFSVSMATICFLTNGILMFVFCRYGLLRTTRNVLLFNQMISGLITTFVVVYPVKIITSPLPNARFWKVDENRSPFLKDYSLCYLVSSGILLLSIYSTALNLCVLVLELLLSSIKRLKHWYLRRCGLATWMVAVGLSWMASVALSILPTLGWNNWKDMCSIPDIWTQNYVVTLSSVSFGATCLQLLAFAIIFVRTERENRRRQGGFGSSGLGGGLMDDEEEEVPICQQPSTITRSVPLHLRRPFSASCEQYQQATRAKITFVHAVICLVTHLPMGVYLLARKTDEHIQQHGLVELQRQHQQTRGFNAGEVFNSRTGSFAEDGFVHGGKFPTMGGSNPGRSSYSTTDADPVLLWTLLPVLFNAVFTPVLYTFMEEPVSTATLRFVRSFACRNFCWPRYTRVSLDGGHQLETSASGQEHQHQIAGSPSAAGEQHQMQVPSTGAAGIDLGGPT